MRALALLGARARIAEIDDERDRIISMFPELGKARRSAPKETGPSILFDANDANDAAPLARSPADAKKIALEMLAAGKSGREVADASGRSHSWVRSLKAKTKSKPKAKGKTETNGRGASGSHGKWRARRQHDDAFKAEAVRRVKIGEGMSAVARDIDVSQSVLSRWVAAAGFGAQKKNLATTNTSSLRKPKYSTEQRETAIARMKAGESQQAVADSLGVPVQTVGGWSRGRGAKLYATKTKSA
jgi:transposase-like protein